MAAAAICFTGPFPCCTVALAPLRVSSTTPNPSRSTFPPMDSKNRTIFSAFSLLVAPYSISFPVISAAGVICSNRPRLRFSCFSRVSSPSCSWNRILRPSAALSVLRAAAFSFALRRLSIAFSAWAKYSSCKILRSFSARRWAFRAARLSGSRVSTSFARLTMPPSISFTRFITVRMVPALPLFFSACPRWNSTQRLKSDSLEKMPRQASPTSSSAASS